MVEVTIKQMLEAGVHFGHQTRRWNPKMKRFIFGERNGIYIINLEITLSALERALTFLKEIALSGRDILWVGTKKQAKQSLSEAAVSCGMPYVNERWLGGMLTNFDTVRKSIRRLDTIDKMEEDGSFEFVSKKEVGSLKKEREKLKKNLEGIRKMRKLPEAVFVIDSNNEEIAVREARKLGIPVVALIDTNCNPDVIDYPIPGNDDAIRAVKLFCDAVSATILEGRSSYQQAVAAEEAKKAAEEAAEAEAKEAAEAKAKEEAAKSEKSDKEVSSEEVLAKQFVNPDETTEQKASEEKAPKGKASKGKTKKTAK